MATVVEVTRRCETGAVLRLVGAGHWLVGTSGDGIHVVEGDRSGLWDCRLTNDGSTMQSFVIEAESPEEAASFLIPKYRERVCCMTFDGETAEATADADGRRLIAGLGICAVLLIPPLVILVCALLQRSL